MEQITDMIVIDSRKLIFTNISESRRILNPVCLKIELTFIESTDLDSRAFFLQRYHRKNINPYWDTSI